MFTSPLPRGGQDGGQIDMFVYRATCTGCSAVSLALRTKIAESFVLDASLDPADPLASVLLLRKKRFPPFGGYSLPKTCISLLAKSSKLPCRWETQRKNIEKDLNIQRKLLTIRQNYQRNVIVIEASLEMSN